MIMEKVLLKKGVLLCVLLGMSFAAMGQVYVGGSISGGYGVPPMTETRAWTINIAPEAGYILKDTWAFGARLAYVKTDTEVSQPLTVNPYVAYSTLALGSFTLWAEAGYQLTPRQQGNTDSTHVLYVAPVLTYNLNEHILLKTALDFARLAVIANSEGGVAFVGSLGGDNALNLGEMSIGFLYKF